jgi:Leucine-rich repeat (LRR) protein
MLNISNNNLHSIAVLNSCHALQSLDASGNSIQQIEDLSHLTSLKVKKKPIRNSILFLFDIVFKFT